MCHHTWLEIFFKEKVFCFFFKEPKGPRFGSRLCYLWNSEQVTRILRFLLQTRMLMLLWDQRHRCLCGGGLMRACVNPQECSGALHQQPSAPLLLRPQPSPPYLLMSLSFLLPSPWMARASTQTSALCDMLTSTICQDGPEGGPAQWPPPQPGRGRRALRAAGSCPGWRAAQWPGPLTHADPGSRVDQDPARFWPSL